MYYGCLKGTPYRWLDVETLCKKLLPQKQINKIRYFTARVTARPNDPQQPQRQQIYLRALRTIPNLSIHYGHYLSHKVRMPIADPDTKGPKTVEVIKTEEKGSDVNLATYLLVDAFNSEYDQAIVISGDSDLCLPIEIVRNQFKKNVGIFYTPKRKSHALRSVANFFRPIRNGALEVSQFPPTLTDKHGTITKPSSW